MNKGNEISPAEQQDRGPKATEDDYISEIIRMVSGMKNKKRLIKVYTCVRRFYIYEMEERAAGDYF